MTTSKFNIGDQVRYRKHRIYGSNTNPWLIGTVVKITSTGMMRLEDGSLWYHNGRGQGEFRGAFLEPWDDKVRASEARKNAVQFLSNFKWELMTSEDLLEIMEVVKNGASRL